MNSKVEIKVCASPDELAENALRLLQCAAERALQVQPFFTLAVAGGSSPALLYRLLGQSGWDFSRWRVVYGDERFLPEGDQQRNSTLLEREWLSHLRVPVAMHQTLCFSDNFTADVAEYSKAVAACLPLDFALLGMGEDGHTASLFPRKHFAEGVAVMVDDAPKPPARRMSLNYSSLNSATTVCFLVSGVSKAEAVKQWQQGESLPVTQIQGRVQTYLLLDTAAAQLLKLR